ncbi:MAG: hypothetical protein H7840_09205 [Alphaproteobacteria bacterium]
MFTMSPDIFRDGEFSDTARKMKNVGIAQQAGTVILPHPEFRMDVGDSDRAGKPDIDPLLPGESADHDVRPCSYTSIIPTNLKFDTRHQRHELLASVLALIKKGATRISTDKHGCSGV